MERQARSFRWDSSTDDAVADADAMAVEKSRYARMRFMKDGLHGKVARDYSRVKDNSVGAERGRGIDGERVPPALSPPREELGDGRGLHSSAGAHDPSPRRS
jgi:hypothetical protein